MAANKGFRPSMTMNKSVAKFPLGEFVRHRVYGFRGVVFDIDPEFNNTDEWYESIPAEVRPRKDQPFYHLLAESHDKSPYVAYVSEQNLELEETDELIDHPDLPDFFHFDDEGRLVYRHPMN
ncbi:MAG: heat shock protein HspQ [Rhodospirillaceae bacterium]